MQIDPKKTVFMIDASGFLYRAYYGMRPMHTSAGEPVGAVYSFCRMLKKMTDRFAPQQLALVWDSGGKTERHALFADYKATRQAPPSDLFAQKERILEFANLIGVKQVMQKGVEADDLIYSLAHDFVKQGQDVVLITSDKDLCQLLEQQVIIFDAFKDDFVTQERYEEKLGFSVSKVPFYYALVGDSSDNIPGVRGIGPKGATELVQKFASLDDLYANLDLVGKAKTKENLALNRANAYLSLELFTLRYHALGVSHQDLKFEAVNWEKAQPFFKLLEFKSLLREVGSLPNTGQISFLQASSNGAPVFFADLKGYKFLAITTEQQLVALCEKLKQNIFAIDTETTGLDVFHEKLVGISFCYEPGLAYYLPLGHQKITTQLDFKLAITQLKPILENSIYPKILHNAKFDLHVFRTAGIMLAGVAFDTMIAAHLVGGGQKNGLKDLSKRYFGDEMLSYGDLLKTAQINNFGEISDLALAVKYAAADAHQTFLLYQALQKELAQTGMQDLFIKIEMPLVQVLFEMEVFGIYLNQAKLVDFSLELNDKIAAIVAQIRAIVDLPADFNLNSPRQIEDLLFNKLNLPTQKKSTKKTSYSTDQEVLDALHDVHPVAKLISIYRELNKLKNTYVDALPGYVSQHDHKIHTTFSQISTATGRLASSEPNMQNIPITGIGSQTRSVFEPGQGRVFLAVDYSQIELRVLAYLSQDQNLLQAFAQEQDIHSKTASLLFNVSLENVTGEMRQVAKKINFSVLYGLTPYGLAKDLKITHTAAKEYITKFFAQYAGVASWMEQVIAQAHASGYVTTLAGRQRLVPAIYEKNKNLYEAARRIAINTVVQGTAAELVKKSMLAVASYLKKIDANLVLQIHDELLISFSDQLDSQKLTQEVRLILEQIEPGWNVPLRVTIRTGESWQAVSK